MSESQKDPTPGGRPQSTIAQNFSATLDNAFGMDETPKPSLQPDLAGLSQSVEQKKRAVTTQNQELEALQARLRETEQQLQQTSTSRYTPKDLGSSASAQQHEEQGSLGDLTGRKPLESGRGPPGAGQEAETHPALRDIRPQAATGISYSIAHMPGAMPETPGDDGFQAAWDSAKPERTEQR
ncbi:MAG: hypothetical protein M1812_001124 [Candelaria pacifica]|nr:MAG: hypothetical protein M1812_001124 [Candelaria pacifica]